MSLDIVKRLRRTIFPFKMIVNCYASKKLNIAFTIDMSAVESKYNKFTIVRGSCT